MRHGVLEENQVQRRVDLVVPVQRFQQGFVQAPPGLHRHVFWFPDARGEVAEHIHGRGLLQGLLHILVGIKTALKLHEI